MSKLTDEEIDALGDFSGLDEAKLHKIEVKTEHRFKLSHLESLSGYRNDEAVFYQVAAVAAARKIKPSEIDAGGIKSLLKYYAPWFEQEFPEYVIREESETPASANDQTTMRETKIETAAEETSRLRSDSKPNDETAGPARHIQADVYFAECPHCGAKNPFQFRWKDSEVIFISAKDDGNPEKEACVPDSLYTAERQCLKSRCGKAFKLLISPKGQNTLAIATHKRVAVPEPKKTFTGQILVWDAAYAKSGRESEGWLVVSGNSKARFINGKLVPMKD